MKAVIYTRWSPRPDADTTQSTKAQLSICHAYCVRKGYSVLGEYHDRDASGDDETRPGLWEAIGRLRRGWVLVVADPERLARGVYLEEVIYRDVDAKGARIEAVEGGTHGNRPEDTVIRQVLAAFREYDKKVKAARTRSRMLAHQSNGRAMSKHPPFGYKRQDAALVPDPDEQALLTRIRYWSRSGRTTGWIARKLNAEGQPCRGARGHRETIRRALAR